MGDFFTLYRWFPKIRTTQLIAGSSCVLILLIMNIGDGQSARPPSVKLTPHMEALQVYLDLDHEDVLGKADEKIASTQALKKVLEYKDALEPKFIQLLNTGLDNPVLQRRTQFLKEQWARHEAFLKKPRTLGLNDEDRAILQKTTKQEYIKRGQEQLIQRYREKAIGALLAINTPTAIDALKNFRAKTGNSMLQRIIDRKLLTQFPPPKPADLSVY